MKKYWKSAQVVDTTTKNAPKGFVLVKLRETVNGAEVTRWTLLSEAEYKRHRHLGKEPN